MSYSQKFLSAVDYVLANEGGYSDDPNDLGGCTNFGITLTDCLAHPETGIHTCDDVRHMLKSVAIDIYHSDYWLFEGISNGRVATKLLDMFVNLPGKTAITIMQRAAKMFGAHVTLDGIYGPQTESAINTICSDPLHVEPYLDELTYFLHHYYAGIVEARPKNAKFLKGWLTRADRLPEDPGLGVTAC